MMIRSLAELVEYSHVLADKHPSIQQHIRLKTPGIPEDQVSELAVLIPQLPESVIQPARMVQLGDATIGYFRFFSSARETRFATSLLAANNPQVNPLSRALKSNRLIEIGSVESQPLAVGGVGCPMGEGTIVMLDHEDPDKPPVRVAKELTILLLLAGNLDQLREEHPTGGTEAMEAFAEVLKAFAVTEEEEKQWRILAEITFS